MTDVLLNIYKIQSYASEGTRLRTEKRLVRHSFNIREYSLLIGYCDKFVNLKTCMIDFTEKGVETSRQFTGQKV